MASSESAPEGALIVGEAIVDEIAGHDGHPSRRPDGSATDTAVATSAMPSHAGGR